MFHWTRNDGQINERTEKQNYHGQFYTHGERTQLHIL